MGDIEALKEYVIASAEWESTVALARRFGFRHPQGVSSVLQPMRDRGEIQKKRMGSYKDGTNLAYWKGNK